MRTLASFLVAVQLICFTPLYLMYGQVDPCRALAAELAARAKAAGGLGNTIENAFGDLEISARKDVADKSSGQCVSELFTNWTSRVTG